MSLLIERNALSSLGKQVPEDTDNNSKGENRKILT